MRSRPGWPADRWDRRRPHLESTVVLMPTLRQGSRGEHVERLQVALAKQLSPAATTSGTKGAEMDSTSADLVLEGGGVKGIGLVGAIAELRRAGYRFDGPARIAGTSAGAIAGSLVAAGTPIAELEQIMRGLDFRRFRDAGKLGRLRTAKALSLVRTLGLYRGDYLHRWIGDELANRGVRTFGDLRIGDDAASALPPERSYKLVVIVSDISCGRMLRLPWDYHLFDLDPDEQPVADAVRASASIPFFFRPARLVRPGSPDAWYCTDGGMLSNFPVDLFDRRDGTRPRWPTFGIKLSGRPVPGAERSRNAKPITGLLDLSMALVETMASAHDRLHLDDPAVLERTIFVDTFGTKATDFGLTDETQEHLYRNGMTAAEQFLRSWSFNDYLAEHHPKMAAAEAS
jgi:NTE family protein